MTQPSEAQAGVELHEARQEISTLRAQLASSERRNGYLESENKELSSRLVRRDARMKAEALERLYAESQGSGVINRGSLIDEAREYRRQAGESNDA